MPYIYEGHMGDLYTSVTLLDDTYCEQCGDHDWLIGFACSRKKAWELLKPITDINNSGGWDYDYVQNFLTENFSDNEENDICDIEYEGEC